MGFIHAYGSGYCRFWEWNDNQSYDTYPQLTHCGDDQDGDHLNFKIEKLWQPKFSLYTYAIYNCGTSGWSGSSCALVSDGPDSDFFGDSIGVPVAEVHYGGSSCTDDMLGSSNAESKWGGSDPIEGMQAVNGSYQVRPLNYVDHADCSQFVSDVHADDTFKVYDSNT